MKIRLKARFEKEGKKFEEKKTITGETNAAICTALYLYLNELHDEESHELTIKKISKRYSPWSSKIYTLNIFRR